MHMLWNYMVEGYGNDYGEVFYSKLHRNIDVIRNIRCEILQSAVCSTREYIRTIFLQLNMADNEHIYKWLKYALEKKVKNIQLNFGWMEIGTNGTKFNYSLLSGNKNDDYGRVLKSIVLKNVTVEETIMKFLLTECYSLETLLVDGNFDMCRIKCDGPNFCLKNLTISNWDLLEGIKLSSFFTLVNLTVVSNRTLPEGITLSRFILLSRLHVKEICLIGSVPVQLLHHTLTFVSQVEQLSLGPIKELHEFSNLVVSLHLVNLKKLEISCDIGMYESLSYLVELLNSMSLLQEFNFKVPVSYRDPPNCIPFDNPPIKDEQCLLRNLKEVVLAGFWDLLEMWI